MRHACLLALLAALGVAASACTMPELDGFQLECNWNDVIYEDRDSGDSASASDLCPDNQSCQAGCCVSGDMEPTCHLLLGFGEDGASPAGASCTGGCADYSCKGSCPGESAASCLDEKSTGFPGGICTWPCSNCNGFCAQLPGMAQGTCVSLCESDKHCRKGYRCDCSQPNEFGDSRAQCGCVPDCRRGSPDACGAGRKVEGDRCDNSTGRCYTCLPLGQGCVEGTDCCSGSCCGGLCQEGLPCE